MKKIFIIVLIFIPAIIFSQTEDTIIWQKNHYQDTLAPKFSVTDVQGKTWNSDSLRGKVVVLNFWSIYCPGCYAELPELNKLPAEFSSDSVVFISVVFEKGPHVDSVISKNKFNYHLAENGLKIHGDFYNNCYPTHIVIDRDGMIRYNVCGVVNTSMLAPEIKKAISR